MELNDLRLIYFSPTHTSAKIAYAVAEGTGIDIASEFDLTHRMNGETVELDDRLTIVAVPVYGGRVAETALERLRKFTAHRAPAIALVLYGNRDYEDALRELCDALREQGFVPVAGGAFVGEHSYSRKQMPIAAGRPDSADLATATAFGREVMEKLRTCGSTDRMPALAVKGNFPYKTKSPSTPQAPVTDNLLCTQCGYCLDTCPTGAIGWTDEGTSSDASLCIKCCACVKECPEGARTFDTPYTAMLHQHFSARREPEIFI